MKNATEIICIIDKSGSMEPRQNDAIGGFNKFIADQQALPDEAYLTLVLFDTTYNVINESMPIKDVKKLDTITYNPSGCTALLDAIGKTIDNVGTRFDNLAEDQKPSKVLVMILTDGEENSSQIFNKRQIKEKIDLQTNTYSWEFVYLGANQDAFMEAVSIGIKATNAFNTNLSTKSGVADSYGLYSACVTNYRTTGDIH